MSPVEKVGKYEIAEQIGVGGFGVVYKAWDPYIQRWVALKICNTREQEATQRFFREAQLAGALQHPNITLIYDFGIENETPFFVQEFLSGQDLDEVLERGRLTLDASLGVLLQVCAGLEFAHSRGIIHRDIKPANVRVLEDGTVKIMDFGIAKSLESESHLTQTGVALGTAGYLAPEQLAGRPIDARTDLFSLGVMAYELVTGVRPFVGPNLSNVIYQILNNTPLPPRQRNSECPERLERAILKTLAKDPSARFSSVKEFAQELKQIQAALTSAGPAGQPPTTTALVRQELGRLLSAPASERTAVTQLAARPLDQVPTRPEGRARRSGHRWLWLPAASVLLAATGTLWVLVQRGTIDLAGLTGSTASTAPRVMPAPSPAPTTVPTPSPVQLALLVDPPSEVVIDGRSLGKLAIGSVSLLPGRHTVVQRIAGYREKTVDVEVTAATTRLALQLPPFGYLTVLNDFGVTAQGARVMVDDKDVGELPLRDSKVEAGRHSLRVVWPDGTSYSATVEVRPASSVNHVVRPQ